ncbi:flippase [Vibrio cyclitrophicus]
MVDRKVLNNIVWLMLDKIFIYPSLLFSNIIVAKYFGVEEYGVFTVAQSTLAIIIPFVSLGFPALIPKYIANGQVNLIKKIEKTLYSLAFFVISVFLVLYLNDRNLIYFLICSLICIFQLEFIYKSILANDSKSKYESWITVITSLVALLARYVISENDAGFIPMALTFPLEMFLRSYLLRFVSYKLIEVGVDKYIFKNELKKALPLVLSSISVVVYMKSDVLIVNYLLGPESAGVYSVAVKLSEIWLFIAVAIVSSCNNILFKAYCNYKLYLTMLSKILFILNIFALLITCSLFVTSDFIVEVLYGDEFKSAASLLVIYAITIIFVFHNNLSWNYFIASGNQVIVSYKLMLGAVVNIILNFSLIPIVGIEGAAWASVLSYLLSSFVMNFFFKGARDLFFSQCKSIVFWRVF